MPPPNNKCWSTPPVYNTLPCAHLSTNRHEMMDSASPYVPAQAVLGCTELSVLSFSHGLDAAQPAQSGFQKTLYRAIWLWREIAIWSKILDSYFSHFKTFTIPTENLTPLVPSAMMHLASIILRRSLPYTLHLAVYRLTSYILWSSH